ncbi:unnamed protein product [Darwinula stevensoni]|uniref:protein-tyrosine-phosphatase n=1 Tax=Darwinula stevensoni TaxID=69355 RepID=A0A7R9AAQ9_9CRUS|nr:unnamed protein product [Darwinula stevensoni]CAG0898656.1 unnamed protein product [Darwinula stevensoni]
MTLYSWTFLVLVAVADGSGQWMWGGWNPFLLLERLVFDNPNSGLGSHISSRSQKSSFNESGDSANEEEKESEGGLLSTLLDLSTRASGSRCYGDLGCVHIDPSWFHLIYRPVNLFPISREEMQTQFFLLARGSREPARRMAEALLEAEDCNVVSVDWGRGSLPPYTQAAANIRLVALEAIGLLKWLHVRTIYGLEMKDVHLIGHSLGAHAAGYVGSAVEGIARITGLDPAEPYFQGMPEFVRLDPSDAAFVDAIHTDGNSIFFLGYGMSDPCAHLDFYPNGGRNQPGCALSQVPLTLLKDGMEEAGRDFVACSHQGAIRYFTESITSSCPFLAYSCPSYEQFLQGRCLDCGANGEKCAYLGYRATDYPADLPVHLPLYLTTNARAPYCRYHYSLAMRLASPRHAKETLKGHLQVSLEGTRGILPLQNLTALGFVAWVALAGRLGGCAKLPRHDVTLSNRHSETATYRHGGVYRWFFTSPVDLGEVQQMELHWKYDENPRDPSTYCFLICDKTLYLDSVSLTHYRMPGNSSRSDGDEALMERDTFCDAGLWFTPVGSGSWATLRPNPECRTSMGAMKERNKPLRTILRKFIENVENLENLLKEGQDQYDKEFQNLKLVSESLKSLSEYSCKEGEREVNRRKNRYKDILPFDHTRVILSEFPGVPGSDYINANYIRGATTGAPAYIAAQGPLAHTVPDFWRMVVECQVQVIVMVCNERESGRHKCECYWVEKEGEEKTWGNVTISLVKQRKICPDFLLRTLKLATTSEDGSLDERTVCQFHYVAWPDHGVPAQVRPLLDLVLLVRDCQAAETRPVLVHCSAGCGRTGTLCAIDYVWGLLRSGRIHESFNLFDIIAEMRKQRIAMVQTKDQYILVHRAVRELFLEQLKMIDSHPYENVDMNGEPLGENGGAETEEDMEPLCRQGTPPHAYETIFPQASSDDRLETGLLDSSPPLVKKPTVSFPERCRSPSPMRQPSTPRDAFCQPRSSSQDPSASKNTEAKRKRIEQLKAFFEQGGGEGEGATPKVRLSRSASSVMVRHLATPPQQQFSTARKPPKTQSWGFRVANLRPEPTPPQRRRKPPLQPVLSQPKPETKKMDVEEDSIRQEKEVASPATSRNLISLSKSPSQAESALKPRESRRPSVPVKRSKSVKLPAATGASRIPAAIKTPDYLALESVSRVPRYQDFAQAPKKFFGSARSEEEATRKPPVVQNFCIGGPPDQGTRITTFSEIRKGSGMADTPIYENLKVVFPEHQETESEVMEKCSSPGRPIAEEEGVNMSDDSKIESLLRRSASESSAQDGDSEHEDGEEQMLDERTMGIVRDCEAYLGAGPLSSYTNVTPEAKSNIERIEGILEKHPRGAIYDALSARRQSFVQAVRPGEPEARKDYEPIWPQRSSPPMAPVPPPSEETWHADSTLPPRPTKDPLFNRKLDELKNLLQEFASISLGKPKLGPLDVRVSTTKGGTLFSSPDSPSPKPTINADNPRPSATRNKEYEFVFVQTDPFVGKGKDPPVILRKAPHDKDLSEPGPERKSPSPPPPPSQAPTSNFYVSPPNYIFGDILKGVSSGSKDQEPSPSRPAAPPRVAYVDKEGKPCPPPYSEVQKMRRNQPPFVARRENLESRKKLSPTAPPRLKRHPGSFTSLNSSTGTHPFPVEPEELRTPPKISLKSSANMQGSPSPASLQNQPVLTSSPSPSYVQSFTPPPPPMFAVRDVRMGSSSHSPSFPQGHVGAGMPISTITLPPSSTFNTSSLTPSCSFSGVQLPDDKGDLSALTSPGVLSKALTKLNSLRTKFGSNLDGGASSEPRSLSPVGYAGAPVNPTRRPSLLKRQEYL